VGWRSRIELKSTLSLSHEISSAKKVLGYKTKRNHKRWYDEEYKKTLDIGAN
jgi:hypothetical protein